jgi:hypothetical protein
MSIAFYVTSDPEEFRRWIPEIHVNLFEHFTVKKIEITVVKPGVPTTVFRYEHTEAE